MANKKARVLVDCSIEGKAYKPNDVVELDDKVIAAAEKDGSVDSNAAAVKYAESLKAKAED